MNPVEPFAPLGVPFESPDAPFSPLAPVSTPAQITADWFLRVYRYIPNQDPAIAATVIMAVIAIMSLAANIRFKGHYMWVIFASAFFEALGFGLRILSINQPNKLGPFIGSMFLLITVPIAMAFINYLVFGRILKSYGRKIMFLRPAWIAAIFLISDVLSFLLQGGAAGLLTSKNRNMQKIGRNIIIAGFVIQLFFFVCFIGLTMWASFISPRFKLYRVASLRQGLWGLWITIFLILLRNIYRAVEYIADEKSYVPSHEWTMYVFEFAFIALALIIYNILHFGRTLPAGGAWEKDVAEHKLLIKSREGDLNNIELKSVESEQV